MEFYRHSFSLSKKSDDNSHNNLYVRDEVAQVPVPSVFGTPIRNAGSFGREFRSDRRAPNVPKAACRCHDPLHVMVWGLCGEEKWNGVD